MTIKRPLATAGATVLLGLVLTACGGSAPTDASEDDFCKAVNNSSASEEVGKALEDEDYDKAADLIKDEADKLNDVGTPKGISDDAREGFEIWVDAVGDIKGDDLKDSEGSLDDAEKYSKDEQEKVQAFLTYQVETCVDTGAK